MILPQTVDKSVWSVVLTQTVKQMGLGVLGVCVCANTCVCELLHCVL